MDLRLALGILLPLCVAIFANPTRGEDAKVQTALRLAREYLATDDAQTRKSLATQLAAYDGLTETVIAQLQQRTFEAVEPGYHPKEHFSRRDLQDKHPDDLLYFQVPETYQPSRPHGLIIFMHGGGAKTERDTPRYSIRAKDKDDDEENSTLGHLFASSGLIAVGPSAPWNQRSYYRWCLREADEYLTDVILECKSRFHIDHDRVFLLGHSMGGFGAFHHVQRQPDRFAGVIAHAGSWDLAYWPVIRGTRFWFINGVRDAEKGERWHYTDIAYAHQTNRLLKEHGLDYTFLEHPGGHGLSSGKPWIAKALEATRDVRRDSGFLHVTLATPLGYSRYHASPVRHNRWLTLHETTPGKINFDELVTNDADEFDDWRLEHHRTRREGSSIDARLVPSANMIDVTTQHVARFSIWLHPQMINIGQPVRIVVNGKVRFLGQVRPSLATALDSYLRRQDWGLIYPMRIEISLED